MMNSDALPAKIQIRLRNPAVWSESSQGTQWVTKDPKRLRTEKTDLPAQFLWVFFIALKGLSFYNICPCISIVHIYPEDTFFSHLCLYEVGFLPMWETSILHDHEVGPLVQRTIHLKVGEKKNPSWASPCRIGKSHPRGMNFNQGLGCRVPGWNSYPTGEISLSCMDTHDGFVYIHDAAQ